MTISNRICGVLLVVTLWASPAAAEPPLLLPVQGYLTNAAGEPIDEMTKIRFRLYDRATGGAVLHDETQTVAVTSGVFSAYLGTASDLDPTVFDAESKVHLGMAIEDDDEAAPRLQLGSVPFALSALSCQDAATFAGQDPADFALAGHVHAYDEIVGAPGDTNAATLCDDNFYLDGDGTCKAVSNVTDTNAGTLCPDGSYLDGDAVCYNIVTKIQDNALHSEAEVTALLDDNYVNENQSNSISNAMMSDSVVGSAEVALDSLTAADLAADSVGSSEVIDTEVQLRVSGTCSLGSAVQTITAAGTVTCQTDSNAGTLCDPGEYLDGDALCYDLVTAIQSNSYGTEGELTALLDDNYVDVGEMSSVTSTMITDATITASDLGPNSVTSADMLDGTALTEILDDDGAASLLSADNVDGYDSAALRGGVDYVGGDGTTALAATEANVRSLVVNAPVAGHVIVFASGYFSGTDATARCSISLTSAALDIASYTIAEMAGGVTYVPYSATRGFMVAAGIDTYYLVCDAFAGTPSISDTHMTAIFMPNQF